LWRSVLRVTRLRAVTTIVLGVVFSVQVLKKTTLQDADNCPAHVQLLWFLVRQRVDMFWSVLRVVFAIIDATIGVQVQWDPTGKLFDDAKQLLESGTANFVVRL